MTAFPSLGRFEQFLTESGIAYSLIEPGASAPRNAHWELRLRAGRKNVAGTKDSTASFYFDRFGTLLQVGVYR